jgi:hypothetical protein
LGPGEVETMALAERECVAPQVVASVETIARRNDDTIKSAELTGSDKAFESAAPTLAEAREYSEPARRPSRR